MPPIRRPMDQLINRSRRNLELSEQTTHKRTRMLGLPATRPAIPSANRGHRHQPCSGAKSLRWLAVDVATGCLMFDENFYSNTVINAEASDAFSELGNRLSFPDELCSHFLPDGCHHFVKCL